MAREKRMLVAYATRYGSTAGIAEGIGAELRRGGVHVDVKPAAEVNGVAGYDAVVIGSPVYTGKWLHPAMHLVKANKESLAQRPVAYFTVGLLIKQKPEEGRKEHEAVIKHVRETVPEVVPMDVGMFDGAYDPKNVNFLLRLFLRMNKAQAGDFRDWEAISGWAHRLPSKWREAA